MATMNNIYVTAGEPIARFVRIPQHGITGWRLNPDNQDRKVEFELTPINAEFDYERDVIEIYSEKELKFFRQANRYLFQQGFLSPYEGQSEEVDTTNMLTDAQVLELATEQSIKRIESKLQTLTSRISVDRVYKMAQEIGRPAKTLSVIKARLDQLTT